MLARNVSFRCGFDPLADLALVEHAHARAGPPHDLVAERVERADLVPRAAGQIGEAVLHLGARPPVVRERAHARGAVAALDHEMPEARGEHRRLARTGGREDAGRAAGVQHRGALVGCELVEVGVLLRLEIRAQAPGFDRDAMQDALTGRQPGRARSAIAPRGCVVGEEHVGRAAGSRAEALGFGGGTPARRAVTRVVVVRAHEEVRAFAGEIELGCELVRDPIVVFGCAQRLAGHAQVDDYRRAVRPQRMELVDRLAGVAERVIVDDHARRGGPRLGRGRARLHDDAATERGRTRRRRHGRHRRTQLRRRPETWCARAPRARLPLMSRRRPLRLVPVSVLLLALIGGACSSSASSKATPGSTTTTPAGSTTTTPTTAKALPIGHVFVINLENESFDETWTPSSPAVYLNKTLRPQGQLLTQYFGIGHASLDNYIAQISGQAPNPQTQADCTTFTDFVSTGTGAYGQALGEGCVYPKSVPTIADQLDAAGKTWKSYQEDIANSATEPKTCRHPAIGAGDPTLAARKGDMYATRHNPFVYFHSVIDEPSCAKNVVEPRRADDGSGVGIHHAEPGVHHAEPLPRRARRAVRRRSARRVDVGRRVPLEAWVPKILASPAFKADGMLVITFDEAELGGAHGDSSACCHTPPSPNSAKPGLNGPGGGRVGALVISDRVKPGTTNATPYNHYALLCSLEDVWGLDHLGFAGAPGLTCFGKDVYNRSG